MERGRKVSGPLSYCSIKPAGSADRWHNKCVGWAERPSKKAKDVRK